jgi:hypothetical protein
MKLRITRERGKVIALPLAKAVGDNRPDDPSEDPVLATPNDDSPRIAVGDGFRRRDSKAESATSVDGGSDRSSARSA